MGKVLKLILLFLLFLPSIAFSQSINGKVIDVDGKSIQFASVIIKELNIGTTTNKDGSFSINLTLTDTISLVVTHLGFNDFQQKFNLNNVLNKTIEIVLEPKVLKINEFIVSASTESPPELLRLPVRTILINSTEIQQLPSVSTVGILSNLSGVNINSESGIYSSSVVNIRGVGGNSQVGTLVVLDGVPLNKSDGGSVNWNIIDKENIETIEVVKGPVSPLYGSNAMGGIINIISKQPKDNLAGSFSLSYGTYNTPEARISLSGTSNDKSVFWKAYSYLRTSDGYINTPDEIIAQNDSIIVPVFINEKFLGGLLGYNFNKNHSIEFSFIFFNDQRGRGIKVFEELGSATIRDTYQSFVKYKGIIRKWSVYANLYGLKEDYFRLNEYFSDGEYKLFEVDSKRSDLGLRFWGNKQIYDNEIIFGFEYKNGSVNAKDIYYTSTDLISNSGKIDNFAAFSQYSHKVKNSKLSIITGLRFDIVSFYDANFSIDNPSYSILHFVDFQFENISSSSWNSVNPKFSAIYNFNDDFSVYSTISKGFRAPILDDMCRNESNRQGFRVANPELKAEHVYNFETGIDYLFLKKFSIQFSSYYTKGFNFMHPISSGDSVNLGYTLSPIFKVSNISQVNIYGGELDLYFNLNKVLRLKANYSYINAKIGKFEPYSLADKDLTGKFLTGISMNTASTGLVFNHKFLNSSFNLRYIGKRWVRDDNMIDNIYILSEKYPDYFLVDFKVWKKINSMEFSADINNVFNVVYINSRGYKSPGRMLFFKFAYQFSKNK